MKIIILGVLSILLFTSALAQESETDPINQPDNGEHEVKPDEIYSLEIDWKNQEWKPAYERYEDIESVECGRRDNCTRVINIKSGEE